MTRNNLRNIFCAGLFAAATMSCENQDIKFPDSGLSTVYFAYQAPVRTIVLGEDIFDNSLDNEHKFEIYATMGGVYDNTKKITIDFEVDNSLTNNLYLDNNFTRALQPMPAAYYTLAGNQITLDRKLQGAVQVQLTDAFFADPDAITNTYAIPLRMTNVTNADSILRGKAKPGIADPKRVVATDWDDVPKDYVLYLVKYINPWHANYLRRGVDEVTVNGVESTVVRHEPSVESDQVVSVSTIDRNSVKLIQDHKSYSGINLGVGVKLDVNEDGNIQVAKLVDDIQVNDSVRVYNIATSGTGKFVKKGEKNSWGGKDRDVLQLAYTVSYEVETRYPNTVPAIADRVDLVTYVTSDTLVVRDRGVKVETITPYYNE